jgi:hypothetical protein
MFYFLPILGGQKLAVSDSVEGWLPGRGMVCSRQPRSFRVSIRMDHRMDGQRRDDETRGFRGGFISHPDVNRNTSLECTDLREASLFGFTTLWPLSVRLKNPEPMSPAGRTTGRIQGKPTKCTDLREASFGRLQSCFTICNAKASYFYCCGQKNVVTLTWQAISTPKVKEGHIDNRTFTYTPVGLNLEPLFLWVCEHE